MHVTMDKEEEIISKMTNEHDENELGIKTLSLRWTSVKGVTNSKRTNYCNTQDLRFEVTK